MVIDSAQVSSFRDLFAYIYKGDSNATNLSFDILQVLHTWDDLIDKDKEILDSDINSAFLKALCFMPDNPLWSSEVRANMLNVYLRWNDANKIEAGTKDPNELAKAWMLRAGLYDLFVLLAAKLHGLAWAEEVGVTVRLFYGEKLKDFLKEMKDA